MDIIQRLQSLNLISWQLLYIAFTKNLILKQDIEVYAVFALETADTFSYELVMLANSTRHDNDSIKLMILKECGSSMPSEDIELEKIQLAILMDIVESNISDELKCDRLQKLYSDADHPDNMFRCNIYSNSKTSPIE